MSNTAAAEVWITPTKVRPPRLPRHTVARARLTACLLEGLSRPLTLVAAPAGFGKTTLLGTALAESPWPVAWLFLDTDDRGLSTFLHGLVAAVQAIFPDSCRSTLSLLRLPTLPSPGEIARIVEHDLVDLGEDLVLVLDDYHAVAAPEIDALLVALLRHFVPGLHLVVASRQTPDWPLARLRAAEDLLEIGPDDLAFTDDEAQGLLAEIVGANLSEESATAITTRMRGWAVGLRLAAIMLRDSSRSHVPAIVAEERTQQSVVQYLLEEIVARQPPDVQRFLHRTAIAERICADLAGALIDSPDAALTGARVLAYLERAGLVVSTPDGSGPWYRYHRLLVDALRHELPLLHGKEEVARWYRRASAWFAQAGHVVEALRHALAGDDPGTAADLVEQHATRLLNRDEWQVLEEWLCLLPDEIVRARPALLLAQGWVRYLRAGVANVAPLVEQAEALLDAGGPSLPPEQVAALQAEAAALWAVVWYLRGDPERAAGYGERAWAGLPTTAEYQLGVAGCILGYSKHLLGDSRAVSALLASPKALELEERPALALRLQIGLTAICWACGDLYSAERAAQHMAARAEACGLDTILAWAHHDLGRLAYTRNDLPTAEAHFARVIELRHRANVEALGSSVRGLSLIRQERGGKLPVGASAELPQMLPLGAWLLSDEAAGALDARLALLRGDLPAASRWLQSTPPSWHRQTMVPLDGPGPTRVRVLIALGTEAALAEARHLLADEMDEARRRHNVPRTVETLALQALACQAEGAIADALAALEQAIGLAAPGGFTRCFVELGPPMARLLRELDSRGGAGEHGRRVLAAFGAHSAVSVQVLPSRESLTDELIEPLTEREIEVLALLAGRLSNKEVARTLNISRQTVTKHTVNIYQKLQVHDRREAAQRGRALGLIPAPEPTDMVAVAPTYAGSKPA